MNYLIYGSSDFALVLKDFLELHEMRFSGFIDDFRSDDAITGTFAEVVLRYHPSDYEIVLGIGYKNLTGRLDAFKRIKSAGFNVATLIHRNAYIRNPANIHEGAIVMANVTVDVNAVICEAAVLWPGVVVNHDSIISKNTFISPSATICGFVNVGESCFVGAGAIIADHVDVPNGTFIKAGTVYRVAKP
jgi:sugar O-acyltransferase (sialic acid O-acetyltransferase NeuD family)